MAKAPKKTVCSRLSHPHSHIYPNKIQLSSAPLPVSIPILMHSIHPIPQPDSYFESYHTLSTSPSIHIPLPLPFTFPPTSQQEPILVQASPGTSLVTWRRMLIVAATLLIVTAPSACVAMLHSIPYAKLYSHFPLPFTSHPTPFYFHPITPFPKMGTANKGGNNET